MPPPSFPAESVPDGSVWLPHHFVIGVAGALFVVWLLSADRDKPWLAVAGLLVSLYGWYHVWPWLPTTGASIVIVGLGAATVALGQQLRHAKDPQAGDDDRTDSAGTGTVPDGGRIVRQRRGSVHPDRQLRWIALAFLLIAWDDLFSHAFGVYTPLDLVWDLFLGPVLV